MKSSTWRWGRDQLGSNVAPWWLCSVSQKRNRPSSAAETAPKVIASTETTIPQQPDAAVTASTLLGSANIGIFATELAVHGWPVFPLRGKVPAIRGAHPVGDPLRGTCKGDCGRDGHGLLDATTDLARISSWWRAEYCGANIGVRLPVNIFVVDVDPRNGGSESLKNLEASYGVLPATLTVVSGRGDGGSHRYYRRPSGTLTSKQLGCGIDIKTSSGYVVAPPSIHPASGRPYTWIEAPIAEPPQWLVDLTRPPRTATQSTARQNNRFGGTSIAEDFTASITWGQILQPHGWRCIDPDGDSDGARWLHPAATSEKSATVRHGCLFIYSPNTPFDVTEPGDVHGYTRFRAWAVLNHRGDLRAAARVFTSGGAL